MSGDRVVDPAAVDPQHPWLGLASFTEETRQFFHGREEEVGELARRVQRAQLTVLFGQSGLGKTSILRAGIVPRLRPEGYCPVYVRIDYSAESPAPSEQIKQAIFRATEGQGQWTRPGVSVEGESLWEFLHHRDDNLHDADGKPIVPLLIFDQFEEIFTLAQADEAGRKRAQEFIDDLSDLAENRPPKFLEARLEADDTITDRFDFGRADYRILIALREDYLAHLEGLKRQMPSITQNRMRLARMNGRQALAAVLKPGGALVSQEVAEAIVRFVAGGSELPNAEVEPSLLSLICRELNNARIAQGRAEISADLLAGSHDTILAEFYERALADQPSAVRKVIEDELLTESGYRENLAEERLKKAFDAAGAAPDALATLVNRRLLRIEERLDARRVELTHDVLCGVVRASRGLRLEREALEEAERKLAAQRERERATRRALVRARRIAVGCAVLAVAAVISAVFGFQGMRRAQHAEADALQVRKLADSSRGEAEKLVAYLLDDFYDELAPVGRLDAVRNLARSAVAYYRELPTELRTPDTLLHQSQALVRLGTVLLAQGATDEAGKVIDEAEKAAQLLREQGSAGADTALASARARGARASYLNRRASFAESIEAYRQAVDFLKPASDAPMAPLQTRLLQLELATGLGGLQFRRTDPEARATLMRAQQLARDLKALELGNLRAAELYMLSGQLLAELHYFQDGKAEESVKTARDVAALADRVLEVRPDHRPAIRAKGLAANLAARIDYDNMRITDALKGFLEQHVILERLVKLDPSNVAAWFALGGSKVTIGNMYRDLARTDEALKWQEAATAIARKVNVDAVAARTLVTWNGGLASYLENLGDSAKSREALAEMHRMVAKVKAGSASDLFTEVAAASWEAKVLLAGGKHAEAMELVQRMLSKGAAADTKKSGLPPSWDFNLLIYLNVAAVAQGNYLLAETAARSAQRSIEQGRANVESYLDQLVRAEANIGIAKALVGQGKLPQAQELLRPLMAFHRQKALVNAEDNEVRVRRAHFLMVYATAFPAERKPLLAEAASYFDALPATIRRWKEFAQVRVEIAREQARL